MTAVITVLAPDKAIGGRFKVTEEFEFSKDNKTIAVYQPELSYILTEVNKEFILNKEQEGKVQWL